MSVALRAEKASSEKTPNRCPSQESWLLSQPQCWVAYWLVLQRPSARSQSFQTAVLLWPQLIPVAL